MRINSFFFKIKTHKVLTWHGRFVLLSGLVLVCFLSWPVVRWGVTQYIYCVDPLPPSARIILENWNGNIDMFEGASRVAGTLGAKEVFSIIYEDSYSDPRKRHAYVLNAWAAGIDTTHLVLIPVPKKEPKTLHIGRSVLAYAHQRQWTALTVVTFDLHTARSRKAYSLAARLYNITVRCAGISLEQIDHTNWAQTGSGMASAFSELIKKIYYDFIVF